MKKTLLLLIVILCLGSLLMAQNMSPPKVLVIYREVEKPGKTFVHQKFEAGWPRAFAKANWPTRYLAASSLTGEPRALFLTGYDSMAAWQADNDAIEKNAALSAELAALSEKDGEFLSESRGGAFRFMPELSYNVEAPIKGTRYFMIYTVHVKPGHGDHFNEVRKIALAAHKKANLPDHFAVYQAVAGMQSSGLYLIFLPIKSLQEVDDFPNVHGKAYQDALGEDGRKALADFEAQGIESSELNLFALSPKMSYPPKPWIEADPEFWTPKPAPKPAAKKEAPKP
jgi:hypothetical protein